MCTMQLIFCNAVCHGVYTMAHLQYSPIIYAKMSCVEMLALQSPYDRQQPCPEHLAKDDDLLGMSFILSFVSNLFYLSSS